MRRLTLTLAAATLVLGSMAMQASAQTAGGAASVHALAQNATPIVTPAACRGYGPYCPPGTTRVCGPYRCWCRPCY
jgi:hypothetical protein